MRSPVRRASATSRRWGAGRWIILWFARPRRRPSPRSSRGSGSVDGGTSVTITGTGFTPAAGGTLVEFGASAASNVACTATSCTATSPPGGAGPVHVRVTANGLQSAETAADVFTFVIPPPTVGLVQPNSGPAAGGTAVTITGTGFSSVPGATTVSFGPNPATGVTCTSTTICTAVSPAGAAATVDVIVTVGGVASAAVAADRFTYVDAVVTTEPVPVPALAKGTGYWYTVTNRASGTISATWSPPSRIQGTLAIYAGNPFAGRPDPVKLSPPAGPSPSTRGTRRASGHPSWPSPPGPTRSTSSPGPPSRSVPDRSPT